jgi:hypothetical protein
MLVESSILILKEVSARLTFILGTLYILHIVNAQDGELLTLNQFNDILLSGVVDYTARF